MQGPRQQLPLFLAVWLLPAAVSWGQELQLEASDLSQPTAEVVTTEVVDAAIQSVGDAEELDETTKAHLQELYSQAKAMLAEADKQQEAAERFQSWIENAEQDIALAQEAKEAVLEPHDVSAAQQLDLTQLNQQRTDLEQQLTDAKEDLIAARAEPQRRINRQEEISAEYAAAQAELDTIEEDLEAIAASEDPPDVLQARKMLLQARRQAQSAVLEALDAERKAYEAQGELPRLRVDLATARVKQLEKDVRQLIRMVAERRETEAASQKEVAQQALSQTPPLLVPFAQRLIDLADRRIEIANHIETAADERYRISRQLTRWHDDLARISERSQVATSGTLGPVLLKKRALLPSTFQLQRIIADENTIISVYLAELYELEDRRAELADVNIAVVTALAKLREERSQPPDGSANTLEELFRLEVQILDSLLLEANRNYSLRLAAVKDRQQLLDQVRQYHRFIDGHIFWLRSAGWEDFRHADEAIYWLLNVDAWRQVGAVAWGTVRNDPVVTLLLGASLNFLFLYRRRMKDRLATLGRAAAPISCHTIRPTTESLLLTALLSARWPLVVWGIGWLVADATSQPVRAVSQALFMVALGVLALEFARNVCRPGGLAEAHFGWSAGSAAAVRSHLRLLLVGGLPLALLASIYHHQRNPLYQGSLGRFCLIGLLLLLAHTLRRVSCPKDGVLAETIVQNPNSWLSRTQRIWYPMLVLLPVCLAALALAGYQYSAYRITVGLCRAGELVLLLAVLQGVLFRWVRVTRRRIRWQQLIASRRRAPDDDGSEKSDIDALAARAEEVDLIAMDHQTRRLISRLIAGAGIACLWGIWFRDLAALAPLVEQELWKVEGVGGGVTTITVGALLLAILCVVAAVLASKDVPGLIDVMLLGRLGIESPTRYAISTLSRYALVIVGVLVACTLIGITWNKAQWLIAALSVGLGFGLQEVVANFICGILLLFERPIRVGDIVTLGDTTGAVIRIRSRATTVRNWDRQEVVIPNKELITGRIVNWTLDDQVNRVVINIGVAYGSNTKYVRELLWQIVEENTNVLDDPRPLVTFEQFGDSSLTFVVRVYLANMDERLETVHELHSSINQRFAEEGIEISFPQRDLHLRSVDPLVRSAVSLPAGKWGSPPYAEDD